MLIIGTRGSALARAQAEWVRAQLSERFSDLGIELRIIKTSADRDTNTPIRAGSGVGVFVKEIEEALQQREIDLAVHSMKDVPTTIPGGLQIAAIPPREDARDALVTPVLTPSLKNVPPGSRIGTGSIRRKAQLLAVRPDLRVLDIRGNVDTRLRKMDEGNYDALILACAGLNRLGLAKRPALPLEIGVMIPAPGQGALALEIRKDDSRTASTIAFLHHAPTAAAVLAERAFLRAVGGGCNSPVAVYAWMADGSLTIEGLVAAPDGSRVLRVADSRRATTPEEIGTRLAECLLSQGAREILETSLRT